MGELVGQANLTIFAPEFNLVQTQYHIYYKVQL